MRVTVSSHFAETGRRGERGAEQGVERAADHILNATRSVVPLEDGDLVRSGRVDAGGLHATVSYGEGSGRVGIYAVIQHERLDYNHPGGGRAKYLEGPLLAESPEVAPIIAADVRKAMHG